MWQQFTERARKTVFYAQTEAQRFGEGYVSTEHLLLGVLRESDNVACRCLQELGIQPARVRQAVEKQLPRGSDRPAQDLTLTPRAKRCIDLAYQEALNLGNAYIGTEHLLLGMIREGDGVAGRVLDKLGVDLDSARAVIVKFQSSHSEDRASTPQATTAPHEVHLFFLMGAYLPHHLVLTFLADGDGPVGRAIRAQCENVGGLQWALWQQILHGPRSLSTPAPELLGEILTSASREAKGGMIKEEHLFLALFESKSLIKKLLAVYGVTVDRSRELMGCQD
ncbi:MAG TPA: Clp protease N-terminal domain-containing protein [Fimbriimonadaceae bacterium]|nr:Clp protease N-terminal domain-containing protein [Fimbriimonadaceae bacterium]